MLIKTGAYSFELNLKKTKKILSQLLVDSK